MNVIIYNRTSTKQQFEQSIDKQRDQCKTYCSNNQYTVKEIVQEYGSAYFGCPIKLSQLIDNICENKHRNLHKIIVLSYDRLSRNSVIGMQIIDRLKQHNVIVESLLENIDYSETAGYEQLQHVFRFNEQFSRTLSKRVQLYKSNVIYEPSQPVKSFIIKCKQGGIHVKQLNRLLFKCVSDENKVPLEIVTGDTVNDRLESAGLTYQNIADILNEYKIGDYGQQQKWNSKYVRRVISSLDFDRSNDNKKRMI